jgi:DNA-binding transcriptional regulator YhcF (GntR family)
MGWRDHIKVHPAADLFPMMSDAELKVLGEDIKKYGLTDYICFWAPTKDGYETGDFYLLDGRNRLEAMERVGVEIPLDGKGLVKRLFFADGDKYSDPYAYVISANIHRRHLTTEQRIELTAKVVAAQPEKSDRQIAKQVKVSPTTVGKVRADLEAKGVVSTVDTRTDGRGRQQPAKKPYSRAKANRDKAKAGLAKMRADAKAFAERKAAEQSAEQRKAAYAADEVARPGDDQPVVDGAAEAACSAPSAAPGEWTNEDQDSLLTLALKLLVTVDHRHRKKFLDHLNSNAVDGVYVPLCGHVGWKSGRRVINPMLFERVMKALTVEWDAAA